MSNLLVSSQFNVDSPDARRVILIPMETTLFGSENAHAWKASILEKGLTLEIELGSLFRGLVHPKYSKLEPQVMTLDHQNNVWASNLCFSEFF